MIKKHFSFSFSVSHVRNYKIVERNCILDAKTVFLTFNCRRSCPSSITASWEIPDKLKGQWSFFQRQGAKMHKQQY